MFKARFNLVAGHEEDGNKPRRRVFIGDSSFSEIHGLL